MAYKLNKSNEALQAESGNSFSRDWKNYETTTGDGGFLDSFNALKQQMDFVAEQYIEQKNSMHRRKEELAKDVRDRVIIVILVALGPVAYTLLLFLFSIVAKGSGLLSVFYVFFRIIQVPIFVICEFYYLPAAIRLMMNRLWQKKYLNSGPDLMEYRQKHQIISFDDERRFLDERLRRYDEMIKEIEVKELDKADGVFSILYAGDTAEMIPEHREILERMRKLTVFEDYRASVVETRKEVGPGWLIVGLSILMVVILVFALF